MCFLFFHDTFFDEDVFQDEETGTEESNLNVFGQAPDEGSSNVLPCPSHCTPMPAPFPLWTLGAVFLSCLSWWQFVCFLCWWQSVCLSG